MNRTLISTLAFAALATALFTGAPASADTDLGNACMLLGGGGAVANAAKAACTSIIQGENGGYVTVPLAYVGRGDANCFLGLYAQAAQDFEQSQALAANDIVLKSIASAKDALAGHPNNDCKVHQ
jgi:hypothetical protein